MDERLARQSRLASASRPGVASKDDGSTQAIVQRHDTSDGSLGVGDRAVPAHGPARHRAELPGLRGEDARNDAPPGGAVRRRARWSSASGDLQCRGTRARRRRRSTAYFAAGLTDSWVVVESEGETRGVQINFTPIGARLLLGLPMSEIDEPHGRAATTYSGRWPTSLTERLHDARDLGQHASTFSTIHRQAGA